MIKIKLGLIIKGCHRCQGDMKWDTTLEDWSCMQCGRTSTAGLVISPPVPKKRTVKVRGEYIYG